MLVVGSTQTCSRIPGHLINGPWGLLRRFENRRLVTATMRAQMSLARQTSLMVLGAERVFAADVELSAAEEKSISLDRATAKATQDLRTLAANRFAAFEREYPAYLNRLAMRQMRG
jgi:hypothetical protein